MIIDILSFHLKLPFEMGPLRGPEKKSGKFARLPAAAAVVVYARKIEIETDDEASGNSESLNAPNIINVRRL